MTRLAYSGREPRLDVRPSVVEPALSPDMLKSVELAAACDHPVLLLGETGAGKTYLAREIHGGGRRADRPFVRVNCAAIPDTLFEREVFGHVRGAFTDAREAGAGFFETAHTGTLFLDEIGEVPPVLQSKLHFDPSTCLSWPYLASLITRRSTRIPVAFHFPCRALRRPACRRGSSFPPILRRAP